MGLLKPKIVQSAEKIRLLIPTSLLIEAKAYATWAGFSSLDLFFEEATQYVLSKDHDWKKHKSKNPDWPQENSHASNNKDI